jgi:hypothetical protein
MTRRRKGDTFQTHIGSASGPVHTGSGDIVISGPLHTGSGDILVEHWEARGLTAEEMEALRALFADLRTQVAAAAPPELAKEAQAQVDALEKEVSAEKPDVSKMRRVRDWFLKHLPKVAGVVASVLVNPILGKVVEAAGDLAADELRQRFGRPEEGSAAGV